MRAQEHDPGLTRDFLHNVSLKVKEKVCIVPVSVRLLPEGRPGMGSFAPSDLGLFMGRPGFRALPWALMLCPFGARSLPLLCPWGKEFAIVCPFGARSLPSLGPSRLEGFGPRRPPRGSAPGCPGAPLRGYVVGAAFKLKEKTEPLPFSLVTVSVPPWARTTFWAMAKPRPVPCWERISRSFPR